MTELRTPVRRQEVVAELGQQALEADDVDQLMHDASAAVAETLDAEYCKVLDLLPGGDELLLRQGVGWDDGIVGSATAPTERASQAGYTLLTEEPVIVDDLRTEERFSGPELLTSHDVTSGISVIIGSLKDPWGVLGVHTTERRDFTEDDAIFVQNVAHILASAIESAQVNRRLERTLDLFEKNERIADVGGWEIDTETMEVFWTDHLFDILGIPGNEEPSVEDALDVYHEEDRPIVVEAIDRALEDAESIDVEARFRRPDGEVRWLHVQGVPEVEDGEVVALRGAAQDVTDRKERERELARFKRAVESSGHAIYMTDVDGEITYVNPAFEEITGYSSEEAIGRTPRILQSGEHDDEYYRDLWETVRAGGVWEEEITDRRKNGEMYHAEQTIAPVTDEHGEIDRFVAVQNEITERKKREWALEEYQALTEAAHDVVVTIDEQSTIRTVNPAVEDVFGYKPEELEGESLTRLMPNELAHQHKKGLDRYLETGERTLDWNYLELTGERADGSNIPLAVSFSEVKFEGERYFTGIIRDNTERKEQERELAEQYERYRRLVEVAPVAITIYDGDRQIRYANDATVDLVGVDHPDDLLDRDVTEFVHPDDKPAANDRIRRVLEERESVSSKETKFVKHDDEDEIRHGIVTCVPIIHEGEPAAQTVIVDITEQKERERALERYQAFLEESTDIVLILGRDGAIEYASPSIERILGYDPEEVVGVDGFDLIHPDDRERVWGTFANLLHEDADEPLQVEGRVRTVDDEWRWLEVRGSNQLDNPTIQGIVANSRDITERVEREQALERSEQRYRTLIEHFPNGAVALFDEELRYTAAGGQLFDELDVDDPVGDLILERYPEEIIEEVEPYFHAALEGEASEFELEYLGRYLLGRTVPVRAPDGEVFAGMLVVLDVTERKRYQRELESSHERLEQFASAVSHDLKEPLTTVTSYLQLLERRYAEELDEDAEEFIEFAVDSTTRMQEMIDGIVSEYARVDRGDTFETVDLDAVFEDVLADLNAKIDESDAEVTADSLPRVEGDVSQLHQLLLNLLDNAIKYSGERPPRVHVSAEREGEKWMISVHDEGIGIDPDDTEAVFEVFHRLHDDDDEYPGTGIGLALCRRIVERHGGEIWAESESSEGSTFSFTLPATEVRNE